MFEASSVRWLWLFLVLVALALRIPGMFHDFWLDEVWSYLLVRELVSSPVDVLTRVRIDNNHPINSWFLYALGDQTSWFIYRIPSLAFGIGAVALAGHFMSRHGRPHAVAAMVLVGSSYPLIVYASEARGYASMVFFVLLAIHAHQRHLTNRDSGALVVFWLAVVLGLLSHLTFLHAYLAILLWTLDDARRRDDHWRQALVSVVRCHAVPLLGLATLYLVFIRHLRIGGAEPAGMLSVIAETVAVSIGVPSGHMATWIALPMFAVFLGAGLNILRKSNPELVALFFSGIVMIPALTIAIEWTTVSQPRLFPRYFLVSITLCLLLGAFVVGELYRRGAGARRSATLLVCLFIVGNLWHVTDFSVHGRGHYRDALGYMARADGAEIRVSSNSDFRTSMLLAFYRRYLPEGKVVVFYPRGSARSGEAKWRILEDLETDAVVRDEIDDGQGRRFRLRVRFPFYGLSGFQWSLYERVDAPPIAPVRHK